MKSAIGFKSHKTCHMKYISHRNGLSFYNADPELDELVELGLMERSCHFDEYAQRERTNYHVTAKGFDLLSEITEIKITEDKK